MWSGLGLHQGKSMRHRKGAHLRTIMGHRGRGRFRVRAHQATACRYRKGGGGGGNGGRGSSA